MSLLHAPKKHLGQNFLQDKTVVHQIIEALDFDKDTQALIEIGPGRGALTYPLLEKVPHLEVIELDRDLLPLWEKEPRVQLHHQDVLTFDFAEAIERHRPKALSLVGNLPYNIATPLIIQLMPLLHRLQACVFMVQLEVANRLVAKPASKAYGRLSVVTQYFADMYIVMTVPREAFYPQPKVLSAVVHFKPRQAIVPQAKDWTHFSDLLKTAFEQRRKTLSNALKSKITAEEWTELPIAKDRRAETLSVAEWVSLSNTLLDREKK